MKTIRLTIGGTANEYTREKGGWVKASI